MPNISDMKILDPEEFEALSVEVRRERNLRMFDRIESIGKDLRAYTSQLEIVYHDDGQPDVLFRGDYLYKGLGAQSYTRQQLDEFWANPARISMGVVDGQGLDQHTRHFGEKYFSALDEAGVEISSNIQDMTDESYFLFVLGIGLAPHLEELIEKTQCRVIALFDLNFEFLSLSLSVFDWASLLLRLHNENRRFLISICDDPKIIEGKMSSAVRQFSPSALDGTYFYMHYHNASFKLAYDNLLREGMKVGMMGLGYMWDEMRMIANTYTNLEAGTARVIKKMGSFQDIPVFVVANGPSLDETIDFIKKHQNDAIILACGSTLDPLLLNGIQPDVLLMLEMGPGLLNDQKESSKLADLSDIVFVGASNIFPGVMDYHKEKILFFRPGLSSCPLFSQNNEQRPVGADPLVANAGMMFSIYAGFKSIYLFGVDVGASSAEYHHSKHSQYATRGVKYNFEFKEKARGNFGGEFLSTPVLMWSRSSLEHLIRRNKTARNVYNCSNGLLINGAIPRHFSTIEIEKVPDKKAVMRSLVESFPRYEVEDFQKAWEDADIFNTVPQLVDKLKEAIDLDFATFRFLDDIMLLLQPGSNKSAHAMLIRGTIFNIMIVVYTTLRRIKDREQVDVFADVTRQVFNECLDEFVLELDEWFSALVNDTLEFDW